MKTIYIGNGEASKKLSTEGYIVFPTREGDRFDTALRIFGHEEIQATPKHDHIR